MPLGVGRVKCSPLTIGEKSNPKLFSILGGSERLHLFQHTIGK